jgi:hypothetical protein
MRHDMAENIEAVREQAIIAAREAVQLLNTLERLKQPSQRYHFSLEQKSQRQLERERIDPPTVHF